MGISGLLPLLKSIQVNTHVKQYAGKVVGIDAYVWLHRGAFSCAWDLALGNPTTKYVDYAMHRIKMLRHYGVEPYVVFDGDYLPSKLYTEDSRAAKRAESLAAGMRFYAQKQHTKATEHFQKCVDITPEMAHRFILALRREGIAYVVAPYEADAQLAYLEKKGLVQAVVTEDSDLLVFGCKTLLLKMSQFGDCIEIKRERFAKVTGQITLHGFTDDDFRHMAILSGCDYLASINGVGIITAHRLLRRYNKSVSRVVQSLRLQTGTRVPPDYLDSFHRASMTFKHQRVFCPESDCMVMWNEPDEPLSNEILVYIGADLDVEIARGVARGDLHPMTKELLGSGKEYKENIVPSKHQAYIPTYRPKPPTPPKSKPIHSFFTPQPKPLADITPIVQKNDSQKVNTAPSTPKMFSKPKSVMKRDFNAMNGEETITSKRARMYLGSDDDSDSRASPFFSKKMQTPREVDKPPEKFHQPKDSETLDIDVTEQKTEEINEVVEIMEERQVSESPPRPKPTEETSLCEDEIIPDSPPEPGRNQHQIQAEHDISDVLHASWCDQPESQDSFLPTPPLSCPSQPTARPFSNNTKHTPILRPGMKKAYTPRPSHTILPDTPTPSPTMTPEHSQVVQGWKERFLNTSNQTPTFMKPISTRTMTPLHNPLLRRKPLTPSTSLGDVPAKAPKPFSSWLAAEQIEDMSPSRDKSLGLS